MEENSLKRHKTDSYFRDSHGRAAIIPPDNMDALELFLLYNEIPATSAIRAKRCWLYARTANDSGNPMALEAQLGALRLCAGKYGMTVAGETSEVASGMVLDRAGLAEIMTAAEAGAMDILLVKEMGRISRNYLCASRKYFDRLKSLNIAVVFADMLR